MRKMLWLLELCSFMSDRQMCTHTHAHTHTHKDRNYKVICHKSINQRKSRDLLKIKLLCSDWQQAPRIKSYKFFLTSKRVHFKPRLFSLHFSFLFGCVRTKCLSWWESCSSQETRWGWTHERQPHWRRSVYELTCDSHASVVFAFLYGVHDFIWTAHKTLCTPLRTHAITRNGCVKEPYSGPALQRNTSQLRRKSLTVLGWFFQRKNYTKITKLVNFIITFNTLSIPPCNNIKYIIMNNMKEQKQIH